MELSEIFRAFAHAQMNRSAGSKKLYFNLEKQVIKSLDKANPTELSNMLYSYSIRNMGNPEVYKAFDSALEKSLFDHVYDYASLSSVIYYLMFRDNTDEKLWK